MEREVGSAYAFGMASGFPITRHQELWLLDGGRERGESKESRALASPYCLHATQEKALVGFCM